MSVSKVASRAALAATVGLFTFAGAGLTQAASTTGIGSTQPPDTYVQNFKEVGYHSATPVFNVLAGVLPPDAEVQTVAAQHFTSASPPAIAATTTPAIPPFNPQKYTDDKGHYHPDWYLRAVSQAKQRLAQAKAANTGSAIGQTAKTAVCAPVLQRRCVNAEGVCMMTGRTIGSTAGH